VVIKRRQIYVPTGPCPYNPRVIPTSRVVQLSIDTGPLPLCQALPCFAPRRRRHCR